MAPCLALRRSSQAPEVSTLVELLAAGSLLGDQRSVRFLKVCRPLEAAVQAIDQPE
jgi:hypothetical protein